MPLKQNCTVTKITENRTDPPGTVITLTPPNPPGGGPFIIEEITSKQKDEFVRAQQNGKTVDVNIDDTNAAQCNSVSVNW